MTLKSLISSSYLKGLLLIIGIVPSVYGFNKFMESRTISKYVDQTDKTDIMKTQSIILDSLKSISDKMEVLLILPEKIEEQKSAYNALRGVVLDYISKDKYMTIDQFKNYMESTPELKKAEARVPKSNVSIHKVDE